MAVSFKVGGGGVLFFFKHDSCVGELVIYNPMEPWLVQDSLGMLTKTKKHGMLAWGTPP